MLLNIDVKSIIEKGQQSVNTGGSLSKFSDKVDDLGGGSFNVVSKIGIWIAAIFLIIAVIKFFGGNSTTTNEAKGQIIRVVIGVVLIASGTAAIIWLSTLNLFA